MNSPPTPTRSRDWAAYLLATIVLLVFGRILANGFVVWDDIQTLYQNEHLNPATLAGLKYHWLHAHMSLWVPFTYTIWWLLAGMGYVATPDENGIHLDPSLFHAASLLIHLCATLIAYQLLRQLTHHRWVAFLAALLFAIHPLQVEAIAWASGLKDLLWGTLALVALWQWSLMSASPRQANRHYFFATLVFVLALLSKPTAVVIPFMVIAFDCLLARQPLKRTIIRICPWFALSIPIIIIAIKVQPANIVGNLTPAWTRPLVALDAIAFYMWKLTAPLSLAPDYARHPVYVMQSGQLWWTWIFPVLVAVAIAILLRRRQLPMVAAGAVLAVVAVLPNLGVVPFMFQYMSTTADHYLYAAFFGIAMIAAGLMDQWPTPHIRTVGIALCLLLGILSIRQAGFWYSDDTLFSHAVTASPNSFSMHNNLGFVRYQQATRLQGQAAINRFNAARMQQLRAVEINPDDMQARLNLILTLRQLGLADEAAYHNREVYRIIIRARSTSNPGAEQELFDMGQALLAAGDTGIAIEALEELLIRNPNFPRARELLAEARYAAQAPATTQHVP